MYNSLEPSILSQLLIAICAILLTFTFWILRRQNYFKNLGIPYVKSFPLLGSFSDTILGNVAIYDVMASLYNRPEVKDKPLFGIFLFHKPALVVNDPELIKKILVKDFHHFSNRYVGSDTHDPLGYYNLFMVKNPLWKSLRGKMSPFFSSGKLKTMYYLLDKISSRTTKFINGKLDQDNKVELEQKELASLYSTDVIASCAYGVEANSLENPDGEFRKAGFSMFDMTFYRSIEFLSMFMLPRLTKMFNFKFFSKSATNFIEYIIPLVMKEREKTGNKRNDLIDTLNELKNTDLTLDMLVAQAAVFFSGGFETSSTTQSFCLYEVVKNEGVQEKLRKEIKDMLVRTEGKVTYDSIMNTTEMPYLNQVVYETLRMYPILAWLDRVCVDPEGYCLEPFSDFKIPYGMPIYIPIFPIQRDAKYFQDPHKFDPTRFAPENIHNIKPFTFIPFGTGPRNCIGERFGLMQVKTAIVKILKDFRLEATSNTPKEIVLAKNALVVQSDKGLFLNMIKDPLY